MTTSNAANLLFINSQHCGISEPSIRQNMAWKGKSSLSKWHG